MNDESNPKEELADDWEISLPQMPSPANSAKNISVESEAEDWGMTNPLVMPPNQPDSSGWKQSEPTFRTSEGYAPKKLVETAPVSPAVQTDFAAITAPPMPSAAPAQAETAAPLLENTAPATTETPLPVAAVEEQPDISEQLIEIPPEIIAAPATKPQSKALRIVSVAAGLLAMFGFAVIFLIVVYYLFFRNGTAH